MAKIYYRKFTKSYYVNVNGKQIALGKDKEDAERQFHQLMLNPQTASDRQTTVDHVIQDFLIWVQGNRSQRFYKWYKSFLLSFAKYTGTTKITDLKARELTRWVDVKFGKKTANTKNAAVRAVKQCFGWARAQNLIHDNPFTGVKAPTSTSREHVLTQAQFDKLLTVITDQKLTDITICLWESGARPEELRIARSEWFNKKSRTITIPKALAKGKKKSRVILLSNKACEIVERLAAENPDGNIFTNSDGNPWQSQALLDRYKVIRKRVDFYVSAYVFRHSFATILLEQEVDIASVASLMGNKISTVEKHYSKIGRNLEYLHKQLGRKG